MNKKKVAGGASIIGAVLLGLLVAEFRVVGGLLAFGGIVVVIVGAILLMDGATSE